MDAWIFEKGCLLSGFNVSGWAVTRNEAKPVNGGAQQMASAQFFRTHPPFGDHEISSPCLFLLHGLDVLIEVRNALLYLALVTLG